jgi:hypothetical protein
LDWIKYELKNEEQIMGASNFGGAGMPAMGMAANRLGRMGGSRGGGGDYHDDKPRKGLRKYTSGVVSLIISALLFWLLTIFELNKAEGICQFIFIGFPVFMMAGLSGVYAAWKLLVPIIILIGDFVVFCGKKLDGDS